MKNFTKFLIATLSMVAFIGFGQTEECNSVTSTMPLVTLDNDIEVVGTVDITDDLRLTSLSLDIEITHTYIGDIKFNILTPSGRTLIINQGQCTDGQNMDATYTDDGAAVSCTGSIPAVTGDILPFSPFSTLNGETTLGTWSLVVTDAGPGDTGVVTSWTLNYCGTEALGVEDVALHNLLIAPNPVKDELSILFNTTVDDVVLIDIVNLLGQTVKTFTTQQDITVPVHDLSSGIYLINFSTNQSKTSRRFIVE